MVKSYLFILLCIFVSWNIHQENSQAAISRNEISLERTSCFGPCPVYKVVIHADGSVIYNGEVSVPRIGTYKGYIGKTDFQRLLDLADAIKFNAFKTRYDRPATDQPTTITSITRAGKRKFVQNYGEAGPVTLWAFERVIDSIVADVKDWKEQK